MRLVLNYQFTPKDERLCITDQGDSVWLSCQDYGICDGGRYDDNGRGFTILFEPRHLPKLRDLVKTLERVQAVQETEAKL